MVIGRTNASRSKIDTKWNDIGSEFAGDLPRLEILFAQKNLNCQMLKWGYWHWAEQFGTICTNYSQWG